MKRIFAFLMILLIHTHEGSSQTNLKEIIKTQSRIASQMTNPMEGFGRKISGEDIVYHSTRQDCQKALLVRASDGTMSISWETPPMTPADQEGDVQLFLIAGMSLAGYEIKGVDPGFQVYINDQPYFHFRNSMGENWTASGPEGSRMVFQTVFKDQANFLIQVHIASSSIAGNLRNIADSEIARGVIKIMASSHQDIAWMDSPQACVEDRDNLLITPALKKLEENPLYDNDMEDILMLREYLARHPEKKSLIHNLTREGRLTWGASYIQPYEEMYFGEALIRQFYLGRKWFKDQFPGCDARIYWNVDVPGRTLQMPQILAKSGVNYMIISRHDRGMFNWLSPDGSKVLTYSPGHYYNDYINLKKGFFETVQHISDLTDFLGKYYTRNSLNPVMPILSDADMAVPDSYFDYIDMWNSLKNPSLKLPELVHSTAEKFMDAATAHGTAFPTIQGERPAVWLYIHGPSHYEALKAGRSAGMLLPAAEKMASFRSIVLNNWTLYPQDRLVKAWESAIYPDHGWGGKNGDVTDQTFLDKYREAEQIAKKIIEESTLDIAGHISFIENGIPLVVFNSLTWDRTDPVEVRLNLPDKTFKAITLLDQKGKNVNFQLTGPSEYFARMFIREVSITGSVQMIAKSGSPFPPVLLFGIM